MLTTLAAILAQKRRTVATPWWLSGGIAAGDCVAAYAPKGAADLAASYVNLANPGTYNTTVGVVPTFNTATGWQFNGIDQYLICPFGFTDLTGMIIRWSDQSGDGNLAGVNNNPKRLEMQEYNSYLYVLQGGGGPSAIVGGLPASGCYCLTGRKLYKDGTPQSLSWSTAISPPWTSTQYPYIGCRNNYGGYYDFGAACKIQAIAFYSATLTDDQVAALTVAMNAL